MIYFFHRHEQVSIPCLIFHSLHIAATSPRGNQSIIFPHLIHEICFRASVAPNPNDEFSEPLGPIEYERISDRLGGHHRVLIAPLNWFGPLDTDDDHSDDEGDVELDLPQPTPVPDAVDPPPADDPIDHVIPPQAAPNDFMCSLLQSVQAMQAQQAQFQIQHQAMHAQQAQSYAQWVQFQEYVTSALAKDETSYQETCC